MTKTIRMLDLFAGCGGLTQGFVSTGRFTPVGAVELERDAAATYAANFGDHVHCGDIVEWARGGLPLGEVVVGGPPCQGFSSLGRRDPTDPRNSMWRYFAEVVARVRPAFFVIENVPGFLGSADFAALSAEADVNGSLGRWRIESHVLDASHYGAAQVRKRAFVIGRPVGLRPLGTPERTSRRNVLRDVLGQVEPSVERVDLPVRVASGRSDSPGPFTMRELHLTVRASEIALQRYRAVPPGGGRLDLPHPLRLPAWRGDYRGAADVMGRLRWDRPAVTIRTEFFRPEKGRFLHPDEHRPLTHYEAALLQGFPEHFVWRGSKASIGRQIGNAVPVALAAAVGRQLAGALAR